MTTANTNTTRRVFTRELREKLSEADITERGRRLAARRGDRAQLDEKRKSVAKDYGGQLAVIDAELDALQSAIQTGSELRPVACYEQIVGNVVQICRADTDAVVDTRVPTLSEQQVSFPGLDDDDVPDDDTPEEPAPSKVRAVKSATGGMVAHMPDDDDDEAPTGALPAPPAKGKAKRKGKAKP